MKKRIFEITIPENDIETLESITYGNQNLTTIDKRLILIELYSHCSLLEKQLSLTKEDVSAMKSIAMRYGEISN
jgi:hypothetical protein